MNTQKLQTAISLLVEAEKILLDVKRSSLGRAADVCSDARHSIDRHVELLKNELHYEEKKKLEQYKKSIA